MVRKQIYLEEEQERRLKAVSRRTGISEAALIRRLLDRGLRSGAAPLGEDPLDSVVGLGSGSRSDVSHRVDEHLYGVRRRSSR